MDNGNSNDGYQAAPLTEPGTEKPKRSFSALGGIARLGIGVAIVGWLIARMNIGDLRDAMLVGAGNWPLAAIGCALLLMALLSCGIRWQLLLEAQSIKLPVRDVFRIFFTGQFFNLFMIGATGGDLVKAYLTARTTGGRKPEAVSTVLIDRIIGLTALAWLAGIAVIWRAGMYWHTQSLRPMGLFVVVFAALMSVFVFMPFSRYNIESPFFKGIDKLPGPAKRFGQILRRSYETCLACRADRVLLAKTFGLSFANHLLAVAACMAFGRALALDLPPADYLAYIPVIGVFGAIPITPGGLGLREGAAVILLATAGIGKPEAVLLSLMLYAGMTVWSLIGGLLFFVIKPASAQRQRHL